MEKKLNLIVAEAFSSIQGEGQTMGVPAVFLRLGGCNLLCKSDNWICDTIEVWQNGKSTPFESVLKPEYVEQLRKGAHLVITGGEPMAHQKMIVEYLNWFVDKFGFGPIIEIETNGTIAPKDSVLPYMVNFWNVSPKLSTSGETKEKRIKPEVLKALNEEAALGRSVIFKFVISQESDFKEIQDDFLPYIDMDKVVLMPAGSSREELEKTRMLTALKAIDWCCRYSERLHVVIWNLKTGV